jgi:hypothetical protein
MAFNTLAAISQDPTFHTGWKAQFFAGEDLILFATVSSLPLLL